MQIIVSYFANTPATQGDITVWIFFMRHDVPAAVAISAAFNVFWLLSASRAGNQEGCRDGYKRHSYPPPRLPHNV